MKTAAAVLALSLSLYATAGPLPPEVTIRTRDLRVTLEAVSSWTVRSLDFRGTRLVRPAGGQGAVLQNPDGKWVGSAMQPKTSEPVESIEITGGTVEKQTKNAVTVAGDRVTVRKQSTLGGLRHWADTVFEADRFVQHHRFEALAPVRPKAFYAFLYSFTPETTEWAAQPLNGQLRQGKFQQTGGHVPGVACQWLAQFDPKKGAGVLVYFQTPFANRGASTSFWDAKSYHKFLASPFRGVIPKGAKLDYTLVVQCFQAPAADWLGMARARGQALKKEFPMKKVVSEAVQAANPRVYDPGVPETGDLLVKTGHYTVRFEAGPAWTMHQIEYGNTVIAGPTGWYGTVLIPKGGNWWGTGHTQGGREVVHRLELVLDGKKCPLKPGDVVTGRSVTLTKDSTIYKFGAHVEVTVTDDFIHERTRLTALEDCDLKLLYYFMHCFIPSTTTWAAELADGSIKSGELDFNKGMSINADTRWVAQYDPKPGLAILCYTPKVISGPHSMSKIWNQPRYHKYYIQQNSGQHFKKGDRLDYELILKAVPGETGDWSRTKAAVAELEKRWPPKAAAKPSRNP